MAFNVPVPLWKVVILLSADTRKKLAMRARARPRAKACGPPPSLVRSMRGSCGDGLPFAAGAGATVAIALCGNGLRCLQTLDPSARTAASGAHDVERALPICAVCTVVACSRAC